jgi:23S rRNA (uracil1939-C5)-methyltransferase
MEPRFYREWKSSLVREALKTAGVFPKEIRPTIFIGGGNRRRATFSIVRVGSKVVMGYYGRRTKEITEINECLIADPMLLEIKKYLRPLLHPMLLDKKPVDVFVQITDEGAEMVGTGPVNRGALLKNFKSTPFVRVGWRRDEESTIEQIQSTKPLRKTFGDLRVNLPPMAFLQPTPQGEKALVDAVMAAVPAEGRFADLFSGSGTFTGPLLSRGTVDAYESSPGALRALMQTKHPKLRVFKRDLYKNPLHRDELGRYDAVVFDPPRGGCEAQAKRMAASKCKTLIYVSCNPTSFARDARHLSEGGYRPQSVQAVDQFLWSHHLEVVGVFRKG